MFHYCGHCDYKSTRSYHYCGNCDFKSTRSYNLLRHMGRRHAALEDDENKKGEICAKWRGNEKRLNETASIKH